MALYITKVGDADIIMEAPAGGGLAKGGDSKLQGSPQTAGASMLATMRALAIELGKQLNPVARGTGSEIEVQFAVRADSGGIVMVSETAEVGQFRVTVRLGRGAPPPRPAPPGAPPPGAPPRPGGPPRPPEGAPR
jgi:hypothetical protein